VKHLVTKHTVDLFYIDPTSEEYLDLRPLVQRVTLVPGPKARGGLGVLTARLPARRAYDKVAEQVNAGGYDLAFVMQCKITNSPAVLSYLKIPSLYFCHEPLARTLEPHFWARSRLTTLKRAATKWQVHVDRTNARHATVICANSLYSSENIYRAYGVYPRFSQLGVDADHFPQLDLKRERVVLSVGALQASKAHDLVIESVGTLEERPTVQFIHNSSSRGHQQYLQELADRRGVTVSFSRLVRDEDLVQAYNRAAVVAFPSHLEPFGFVPLEAMACGTPVVGVAEGGVRETVKHGVTGLLTERNPVDFGRALGQLLTDDALRVRMGAAGRQHVLDHWRWDQAFEMLDANVDRAAGRG
jgi:glycosyltransferase involved in cell wall biosynthesis